MKTCQGRLLTCLLCALLIFTGHAQAEEVASEWITFLLICNEGMRNDGGNVGNTLMILSMNPYKGVIKELTFLWDTFIEYPGYEAPQLLDQPFRVNGPEESLRLFNQNFGQNITAFLSLNFLSLASVIDAFGGVAVDVTRAERNALNGMVTSKIENVLSAITSEELDENLYNALLDEYYLLEYGPGTRLSGMQAVGYGWLQYDSVANCCMRELEVVAQLFFQIRAYVESRVWFCREGQPPGTEAAGKRVINVDKITEDERRFLLGLVSPVFNNSYHNLTEEQIWGIAETILLTAYADSERDASAYADVQMCILPVEYDRERERLGAASGILVDYEANKEEIERFLFDPDYAPMKAEHAAMDGQTAGQP